MTIAEIQALINSKSLDARQLINLIADYLQANPGGGGVTLYTGDGVLPENRIVDLDGKILSFENGADYFLQINATPDNESTTISAINNSGSPNGATVYVSTGIANGTVHLEAFFDDGDKEVNITGTANASGSTLEYTADTHKINGQIINPELVAADFADDTAAATGLIPVGGLYHTGGVVKVRLT